MRGTRGKNKAIEREEKVAYKTRKRMRRMILGKNKRKTEM